MRSGVSLRCTFVVAELVVVEDVDVSCPARDIVQHPLERVVGLLKITRLKAHSGVDEHLLHDGPLLVVD